MDPQQKALVFVEPVSTIQRLFDIVHKKGYIVIIIFTNYNIYPENNAYELLSLRDRDIASFAETYDYAKIIYQNEDYNSLLSELKNYNVVGVFKGSDGGIRLAEKISKSLNLEYNDDNFFDWALNKKNVNEKLASSGIRSILTKLVKSGDDYNTFAETIDFFPVFVKPVAGAGGANSFISYNKKNLIENLNNIFDVKIDNKSLYDDLLVQELILGNEYVVNTFTQNGVHYVVEVWKYIKEITSSGAFIYKNTILLNTNSVIKEAIVKYAIDVLDALDFKTGPCHMEIKVDHNGPVLIECNWRIMGGSQFYDTNIALNSNCCELYFETLLDNEYCKKNFNKAFVEYSGYAECLEIMPQLYGKIKKINIPYLLKKMPSFHRDIIFVDKGHDIIPANSIDDDLGNVQFLHNDYNVLKKDTELFDEINESCFELFFELENNIQIKNKLPINSKTEIEVLENFVGHKKIFIFSNEPQIFNFKNQEIISNIFDHIGRCEYLLIDTDVFPLDNIECFDFIDKLEKNVKPGTILIFTNKTINNSPSGIKYLCCLNNLKILIPSESRLIDDFSFFKKC